MRIALYSPNGVIIASFDDDHVVSLHCVFEVKKIVPVQRMTLIFRGTFYERTNKVKHI